MIYVKYRKRPGVPRGSSRTVPVEIHVPADRISDTVSELLHAETIISYGGGVRWQVTKDKGLNLGIDVGFSGDDYATYIRIGEWY